eukprot:CAMPEP_0172676508 /NCGR_PEP_ID=MMETSP1074-20121228/14033_1 /TAXON_ID=2916 /ORGANISM="Ceratium fusus, Strain PA161109" /LENGTH=725 /DNA_ID=CAMNT_0013494189 /DNA_START=36 /DNA_END=2213 /DNA_ORIENTATION=-
MAMEVLRAKINKLTKGQIEVYREKTARELFVKWSIGGNLNLPQFRMALGHLGMNPACAEESFEDIDQHGHGTVSVDQIIQAVLVPLSNPNVSPPRGFRPRVQRDFYTNSEGAVPQEPRVSFKGFVADTIRTRRKHEVLELICSRIQERGYKSTGQFFNAMDKDDDGILNRNEVRQFLGRTLFLAVAKADEFFTIMDTNKDGKVSCKEMSRQLTPYFVNSFRSFGAELPEEHATDIAALEESNMDSRETEIKKFWELIGHRAADKGFKSISQLLHAMDKNDDGNLDRKETRSFFSTYLSMSTTNADRFFDLLDPQRRGKIFCQDIGECLQPYLHSTKNVPSASVPNFKFTKPPTDEELKQKEIKQYWDLIGRIFHSKGLRHFGEAMLILDKKDRGWMDRSEMRDFFQKYLHMDTRKADKFFDLLDDNNDGKVYSKDVASHIAPYFQNTWQDPSLHVAAWDENNQHGEDLEATALPANIPQPNLSADRDRRPIHMQQQKQQQQQQEPQQRQQIPVHSNPADLSDAVLAEFRKNLLVQGGSHGIHVLGCTLRAMNMDNNMAISPVELEEALQSMGLQTRRKDLVMLLQAIDIHDTGSISLAEFMLVLQGPISARRKQLIETAFGIMDKNGHGRIDLEDVVRLYDVANHPDVLDGQLSEEEALGDFLAQFDGVEQNGGILERDFVEYYRNLSPAISDDDDFESMIRHAWRIQVGRGGARGHIQKKVALR